MTKNYIITIYQSSMTAPVKKRLVLKAEVVHNDFDAHDTAAAMFAIEFAANGNDSLPMRVHIEEAE